MAQFSVKIMRLTGSVLGENQHHKVLTLPGFLLGLVASLVCGWYITLIFCPLYNYFSARGL